MATISADLKSTVATMPHIEEVYFTASGDHYLSVRDHKGKKYGQFKPDSVKDEKTGLSRPISIPVEESEIVETMTRSQILGKDKK